MRLGSQRRLRALTRWIGFSEGDVNPALPTGPRHGEQAAVAFHLLDLTNVRRELGSGGSSSPSLMAFLADGAN